MDFYLGVVIATIFEKYAFYVAMEGKSKQQISRTSPLAAYSIFHMIPTL